MDWARSNPDNIATRLIRQLPAYALSDGVPVISVLTATLLNEFADTPNVLDGLWANLNSFASVGSREPYLAERLNFVTSLADHHELSVRNWAAHASAVLSSQIEEARRRDDEFKHGIF